MPAPSETSAIDLVDFADRPVGQVARGSVFAEHAGFRVVHVLVFNEADDLLLQQVGRTRRRSPLRWGSSMAGYLNAGESYEAAARRRLQEELGLTATIEMIGKTAMFDDGAIKFIGVFQAVTNVEPRVAEPEHIERLEFRSPDAVLRDVLRHPDDYTETFRHVYAYCLANRRDARRGR
ncbi:MAG: hydrolase [Acidimicrobiales bacterium]|nr:hydrolase [Acidimicrobiales bacterium]